jgi:hypothetical protein
MAKTARIENWEKLSDEEILKMRVRDLKLQIPGSPLEPLVQKLYDELDAKGIRFHPPCYLADEWLCPDGDPIIGIPFCLAHSRLTSIEQRIMFDVEGGSEESCMKLLRHEAGHALSYAYRLYRRTQWRKLFGPFSANYSNYYSYQPYSRRYVIHLEDNYAQAHPDEDFAETFAVWLKPGSNWQEKYHLWPVIKKLRYIDGVMSRIADQQPTVKPLHKPPWSASRMVSTLDAYYMRKRRELGSDFKGFYDDSLSELFTAKRTAEPLKASRLLRQHRRQIINNVTRCTGHRKYDIHQLVNRFIARCDALGLYARAGKTDNIIGVTVLLTAIASTTLTVSTKRKV